MGSHARLGTSRRIVVSETAVCCWVPEFALACERARKPETRGRPAALLGPTDARRLWQVSVEARALGVKRGMTIGQGIGFAPTLLVLEADPVHYAERFTRLTEAGRQVSPVVEAARQGLVFIGLDGLAPLYGGPEGQLRQVCRSVHRAFPGFARVAELRLGWAVGKFTAWVAAAAASSGEPVIVPEGEAAAFLASRPIGVLPAPPVVLERLERLGLTTLAQVVALPEAALVSQFGRVGRRLWRYAAGRGCRFVRASQPEKRIAVALEFPEPVGVLGVLGRAIERLAAHALAHPARRGRSVKSVRLTARLEPDGSWSTEVVLKEPAASLRAVAGPLCHRLEAGPPSGAVQRLRLALTAFGPGIFERQLFERDAPSSARGGREAALVAVADELRARRTTLYRVMELAPWSRIPERRHALIDFDP